MENESLVRDNIDKIKTLVIDELSGKTISNKGKKLIDNIIAFTSISGGAGTSTLLANTAYMLSSKLNLSVLVIDTNIAYATQHIYFNIRQELEKPDLVSLITGKTTVGNSIYYDKHNIGFLISNNRNVVDLVNCNKDIMADNFSDALDSIANLFDIILIDCSNCLDYDINNTALYKCDMIYAVIDENVASISNFERFRNNLEATGITSGKIKTIMNKRTSIFYHRSIISKMGIDLMSVIPFELGVVESGLKGEIFCKSGISKSKEFYNSILDVAEKIIMNGGYRDGQ